jgi:hypothetical protein
MRDHNIKVTNYIRFKLVRSLYFISKLNVLCQLILITYVVKCLPLTDHFNV